MKPTLALLLGFVAFALAVDTTILSASVQSLDPSDYRGVPAYVIQYTFNKNGTTTQAILHRQYAEFQQFDYMLRNDYDNPPKLPAESEGIPALSNYIAAVVADPNLASATDTLDFFGQYDSFCQGLTWFSSMESLLEIQWVVTLPNFIPEPPIVTEATVYEPESLFECYLYVLAFKKGLIELDFVTGLFRNYTNLMPSFARNDTAQYIIPGGKAPVVPQFWIDIPVHFQPGGYQNGQNIRISYLSKNKYHFLNEDNLVPEIKALHGGSNPKRILDIGSGFCFTTFSFAEVFPSAQVIGVDLSTANVQFCREWNQIRQISNANFYWANGEQLPYADGSFDIVHFTYVLHEMPAVHAQAILAEAFRLLKPGGTISGFDVPFEEDLALRAGYILFNTWGWLGDYDYNKYGFHGPEPFMYEYEENTQLPYAMQNAGFQNVTYSQYSIFDAVYFGVKSAN